MTSASRAPAHRRVAGKGPTIICLHASTSSSKQWQPFIERMADRFRVVAVDLYGYGGTSPWPGERRLVLDDEVALIAEEIGSADGQVHLVGHSYGGAVAVRAAERYPDKIASLTVYEPVMFGLLWGDRNSTAAGEEILAVGRFVRRQVAAGRSEFAAQHFVEYWSGPGAWRRFPENVRNAVASRMTKVVSDFDAVFGMESDLGSFRQLEQPALLLCGLRSPQSSRRVTQLLLSAMPEAELQGIAELGHMGPVTNPDEVNRRIEEFVSRVEARRTRQSRVA